MVAIIADLQSFSNLNKSVDDSYEIVVLTMQKNFQPKPHQSIPRFFTDDQVPTMNSADISIEAINHINQIRAEKGKNSLSHDMRAYDLAFARAKDMHAYGYLDHKNPYTGTCPNNLKSKFGFSDEEYLIENAALYGNGKPIFSNLVLEDIIDAWMKSVGHRYNLLYYDHVGGAFACYGGYCVFLGVSNGGYVGSQNAECHTVQEEKTFFSKLANCTDEQMSNYESINKEFKDLRISYKKIPNTVHSEIEYKQAEKMYDKLTNLKKQMDDFMC